MNYYIHVPFCASKCGYCIFYSETAPAAERQERYLEKLFSQLKSAFQPPAETIYIGGGTPTLFSAPLLERFLDGICSALQPDRSAEISIEANPETLDREKIRILKKYVNRLSTGVQSFFPEVRAVLGRKCDERQLKEALDLVSGAGFPHWNCDLIYAVPGRSVADWEREFDILSQYPVDHVSCYNLTPEEGARLYGKLIPEDDISPELEKITRERLGERGIFQYEISNYAAPGGACRHNVNVWRGGLLRGFGPSAAGFDGVDRMSEVSSLDQWLAGALPERDRITPAERLNEIFAVNLRSTAGWSRSDWLAVPHADNWENRMKIAVAAGKNCPGCFEIGDDSIKLTRKGLAFWDTIAEELLS